MKLHTLLTKLQALPVYVDHELSVIDFDEITVLEFRLHTFGIHTKFGALVQIDANGMIDDKQAQRALDEIMAASRKIPSVIRSDRSHSASVDTMPTSARDWTMDLSVITALLPDHRKAQLADAVDRLEAGVAAGLVHNQDFTKSKETINWCVESAAKAFLETGPTTDVRYLRWWSCAYDADALISSFAVHNLPTILRRARAHGGLTEYAGFIETALMPLHALMQAAKPLIVKRGEAGHPPPPKTAAQLAREEAQMTCQCCGGLSLRRSSAPSPTTASTTPAEAGRRPPAPAPRSCRLKSPATAWAT